MATYEQAGVNIEAWDEASKIAYEWAKATFSSRKWMIGQPVQEDWGFAGLLDMWDFYLVQGDDGVGTKSQIAESIWKYDTLGFDLLAMVCDDAVCVWAETISITNTLDINKVDAVMMKDLMNGLTIACNEQKIVIPWWEIAELWALVNWWVWNATAVWVVKKDKVITGENIKVWDKIISLYEEWFRSNGFSLVRFIMEEKLWKDAYLKKSPFGKTWGEALLTPSIIYSSAVLSLIWRFDEKRKIDVKGIAHITGWGIQWNLNRVLKKTWFGAKLDNLWEPSKLVQSVKDLWDISQNEAYKTWNMSNGMMLIINEKDVDETIESLNQSWIKSKVAGEIISDPEIELIL